MRPTISGSDSSERDFATWYLRHKRRWPIVLWSLFAIPISTYILLVGYGRQQARKNYPRTMAALVELQPKPIPEATNAAPLWRRAMVAYHPWDGTEEDDPFNYKLDWTNEALYAPESPARRLLHRNADALRWADEAAAKPDANWGLDYTQGLSFNKDHCRTFPKIAFLNSVRARLAAFDNDWPLYIRSLETCAQASRHVARDKTLAAFDVTDRIQSILSTSIRSSLQAPRANWNSVAIAQAKEILARCLSEKLDYPGMYRTDGLFIQLQMDLVARGEGQEFTRLSQSPDLPLCFNWYAAAYPGDRAFGHELSELLASGEVPGNLESKLFGRNVSAVLSREIYSVWTISNRLGHVRKQVMLTYVGVSALEFRAAHAGAWPKSLEELKLPPLIEGVSRLRLDIDSDDAIWIWNSDDEEMRTIKSIDQRLAIEKKDVQDKSKSKERARAWRSLVLFSPKLNIQTTGKEGAEK